MESESHNKRLSRIKQAIQDFKNELNSLLSSLENEVHSKFENVNTRLNQLI